MTPAEKLQHALPQEILAEIDKIVAEYRDEYDSREVDYFYGYNTKFGCRGMASAGRGTERWSKFKGKGLRMGSSKPYTFGKIEWFDSWYSDIEFCPGDHYRTFRDWLLDEAADIIYEYVYSDTDDYCDVIDDCRDWVEETVDVCLRQAAA